MAAWPVAAAPAASSLSARRGSSPVLLSVPASAAPSGKSTPSLGSDEGSERSSRGLFVALADDGVVDRALHARLLLKCGCSTLCFHDAADLMEDFNTFIGVGGKPNIYSDAILLDFDMPKMNGGQATDALRRAGYGGPIVVLTSNADAEGQCIVAGATMVLKKPLTLAGLRATLSAFPPSLCTSTPRSLATVSARGSSQQVSGAVEWYWGRGAVG